MADNTNKIYLNSSGPYYVDDDCVACKLCVNVAPGNFKMSDDGTYAYVYKQPEGDEKELCDEALESCPVEAIGNDG